MVDFKSKDHLVKKANQVYKIVLSKAKSHPSGMSYKSGIEIRLSQANKLCRVFILERVLTLRKKKKKKKK